MPVRTQILFAWTPADASEQIEGTGFNVCYHNDQAGFCRRRGADAIVTEATTKQMRQPAAHEAVVGRRYAEQPLSNDRPNVHHRRRVFAFFGEKS